jgi:hypothetical protein
MLEKGLISYLRFLIHEDDCLYFVECVYKYIDVLLKTKRWRREAIEIRLGKNLSSMTCNLVTNPMSVFQWIIHGLSMDHPWANYG